MGAHLIDLAELIAGPIRSVAGGQVGINVPRRPMAAGHVVGHEMAEVTDQLGTVTNEDTAAFTARFASGLMGSFSTSRVAFGMPNGLAVSVYGLRGRAAVDWHRPAEYELDDALVPSGVRGGRRIIAGPHMAYFAGGYPMQAPGNGAGNLEMFAYQCRAFLDQVTGGPPSVPPCASFTDAYRTMLVVDAVVRSAQGDGCAVAVPAPGGELQS